MCDCKSASCISVLGEGPRAPRPLPREPPPTQDGQCAHVPGVRHLYPQSTWGIKLLRSGRCQVEAAWGRGCAEGAVGPGGGQSQCPLPTWLQMAFPVLG